MVRRRAPGADRLAMAPDHRSRAAAFHERDVARLLGQEGGMTTERPNTIAGLVAKRAEIAGQIDQARATLRQRERGSVRSIKDPRRGQFDLWEIAS